MNLEDLREICLALPAATEDIKYGTDLCFSVGNKIFCGTRIDGPFRTGLKCDENDFTQLTEREGIGPMPRLSATFWIRIEKSTALTKSEWSYYINKSYGLVLSGLSKKVRQSINK